MKHQFAQSAASTKNKMKNVSLSLRIIFIESKNESTGISNNIIDGNIFDKRIKLNPHVFYTQCIFINNDEIEYRYILKANSIKLNVYGGFLKLHSTCEHEF